MEPSKCELQSITQQQLVKTTGLSRRGIEWQLNQLKAKGIIRRIGPDKGGRWEVVEQRQSYGIDEEHGCM